MIFISAGLDVHREDDMANMGLVEADYTWVTQQIKAVAAKYAQKRIISALEGGYAYTPSEEALLPIYGFYAIYKSG